MSTSYQKVLSTETKGILPICIVALMDVNERRRENLKRLLSDLGINMSEAGRRTGVAASYIGSALKKLPDGRYLKSIGEKTARKLEAGLDRPEGWLDSQPITYAPPAIGTHQASEPPAPYLSQRDNIAAAVETIRLALLAVDPLTRAQAKPIIDALFQDPENSQHLPRRLTVTLGISWAESIDQKAA